ncbi:MAG: sulfatase [Promethearchaeota archaeon]
MNSPQNIILIITHDTGDFFGCYGHPVSSPNIDRMAKSGIFFTNYFCAAPQCSPSRGSILTGKMPHSHGLMGLVNRGWYLPEFNVTLPKALNEVGYSTHLIGLQHEHDNAAKIGYQHVHMDSDTFTSSDNVLPLVLEFLKNVEEGNVFQPFFCNIGFFDTHRPYIYPEEVEKPDLNSISVPPYLPDEQKVKEDIADFFGAIKHVDNNIGKIINFLEKECSFADQTLILYTVDHGWAMPKAKCTLYDPGIKTGLVMYQPGKFQGKVYSQLLSNIDLFPTILELVGAEIPMDVQGQSFYSLLKGKEYNEREHIFTELTYHDCYNAMRAIRTNKWKFIKNFEILLTRFEIPIGFVATESTELYIERNPDFHSPREVEELYNLDKDPTEMENLAGDPKYLHIKETLKQTLMQWLEETKDPILSGKVAAPPESMDASE